MTLPERDMDSEDMGSEQTINEKTPRGSGIMYSKRRGVHLWKILAAAAAVIILFAALGSVFFAGPAPATDAPAQQLPQFRPPLVVLHRVGNADLASGSEYIGKVESIQSVALKPQIAGEISRVHFKEGSFVKAGDLLFTLNDRQVVATVDLRKADLASAEANLQRASKYLERLRAADRRSVSASDLEAAESDVSQSAAGVAQAKAALRLAQIDLEYTRIKAPISGQAGKADFTKGNYVTPAGPPLASIVQMDPVRVVFAVPDRDYLMQLNSFKSSPDAPVYDSTLRLPDGTMYPYGGERDFEDNVIDSKTGTIMMRLRFKNDEGLLVPGTMVRVAVKPIQSRVSPVIPQEAIMADREGDYVYTVSGDKIAKARRITAGAEFGNMREVVSGLQAGENVIVQGLQAIRPNLPVNPAPPRNGDGMESQTPADRARASGYDVPDAGAIDAEAPR